jgi:hypothetical protein
VTEFLKMVQDKKQELENKLGEPCSEIFFRGQPKGKELKPRIARLNNDTPIKSLKKLEEKIFLAFKEEYQACDTPLCDTDWDFITLAQHYGLPTRLLDWTSNPRIALWFAVSCKEPSEVWMLIPDSDDYKKENDKNPFENKRTKLFIPPQISKRVLAQSSIFTVHQILKHDHFCPLNENPFFRKKLFRFYILNPKQIKKELKKEGYTKATVLPDLTRICKRIAKTFGCDLKTDSQNARI